MTSRGFPLALSARTRKGFTLFWAALFVLSLLLQYATLVRPLAADAAVAPSVFEGGDGNLAVNGPGAKDWATFVSTVHVGYDKPSGDTDDSYTQGAKEDDPSPSTDTGAIPPNKADLLRFYAQQETVNAQNFLYLAWVRASTTGTVNFDFEFNQSAVLTRNGVNPVRTAGDLLIMYDLSQGAKALNLHLLRWVTSGVTNQCEAGNKLPCWGNKQPLGSSAAEGALNEAGPVLDPVVGGSIDPLLFGEASINLTGAGVTLSCPGFGNVFVKSRSSDAFTSELKDFIGPIPVDLNNCGKLRILKVDGHGTDDPTDDTPLGGATFRITPNPFTGPFTGQGFLDVQDNSFPDANNTAGTIDLTGVTPGAYTIMEIDGPDGFTMDTTERHITVPEFGDFGDATVGPFVNQPLPPTVTVIKTASPTQVPEPGGLVTFSVDVHNTSGFAVTLTTLTDTVYGDLNGKGTCATGGTIAADGHYTCTFSAIVSGNARHVETDLVTATVQDGYGRTATDSDDATVTVIDVMPSISVVKTADPTTVDEPGGSVTFTVVVTNNSVEPVMLTDLTDDVYGDLHGKGTCATGGTIAVGDTYTCSFTGAVSGSAGESKTDTVTATAYDDEENKATASDDATVSLKDVLPFIQVEKTPNPNSLPEPGGNVTFTVKVTNVGSVPVTITSLTDDVFGDLAGKGGCATGAALDPTESYTCSFIESVSGDASGDPHHDTVTATAIDDEKNEATDSDDATVTFTDVAPTIAVEKTAAPTSVVEPGGDVTFTVKVTNNSVEPVTLTDLIDVPYGDLTDGANPKISESTCTTGGTIGVGATYTCTFKATVNGTAGESKTDTVTATAIDDEQNEATASDDATVDVLRNPRGDLTITKTVSGDTSGFEGGEFAFHVDCGDAGAQNVTVTVTGTSGSVTLHNIPAGAECTVTETGKPDAGTNASWGTPTFAPEGGVVTIVDNQTVTVTINNPRSVAPPVVSIQKTNSTTGAVTPGSSVTYTLTLSVQNGPASNVTIVDQLPAEIGDVTNVSDGGTYDSGTNRVTWTLATVSDGKTLTYDAKVSTSATAGAKVNTATITEGPCDQEGGCSDDSTVTVIIPEQPGLTIDKGVSLSASGPFAPSLTTTTGTTVYYRIRITNTGNVPLSGVTLTDNLSNLVSACSPPVPTTLAVATSYDCTYSDTAKAGTTTNTATADSEETPSASDSATVTASTPPTNPPTTPPTPTPTPTATPSPTGSVEAATATPRVTLPPTSMVDEQPPSSPGANLGLLLVLFSGLMMVIGVLTPVPSRARRRDRRG